MRNIIYTIVVCLSLIFIPNQNFAQCTFTSAYGSGTASTTSGTTVTLSTCNWAGEYATINGIIAGGVYRVNVSITSNWVTIRSGSPSGPVVSFAVQGTTWTAPTGGTYYAHFSNTSLCATSSACRTTSVTTISIPSSAPNPCSSIGNLLCGTPSSYALTGVTGAWNTYGGPYSVPGREKVFSFTAAVSGTYTIAVTNNEYYVDLFYKSSACGIAGWTFIDDIYTGTTSNTVTLAAGTTYLFLLDDENTTSSSGTISITCPTPIPDPCLSISTISSCGTTNAYSLSAGSGLWSSFGGPYATPGREKIYRFTPTITGSYPITVTNAGSGWVDLFYKIESGTCGSSGWTYVDDVSGSATNSITLIGGQTYIFLLDDEDDLGSNGTILINCPCIGSGAGVDASLSLSGPTTYTSTTIGSCDDCSLRAGNDRIIAVTIPCAGSYSFDLCGGASWDTYLYLTTAICGGSVLASNDDYCGLQSGFTYNFTSAGTYYITVEGFSATSEGAFSLNISRICDLALSVTTSNVSCFGGNNGIAASAITGGCGAINYSWTNGANTPTISGLTAGSIGLTVTDGWGCSASTTQVVEQPALLEVNLHSTEILCHGQLSTVEVSGVGGTAPYMGEGTFNLTAGSYVYTLEDVNGCSASASIDIYEPAALVVSNTSGSILCYGGTTSIELSASGGTIPYTGVGSYTVGAGAYDYTVSDANGCYVSTVVVVSQPDPLDVSVSGTAILCTGGTSLVEVIATGGTIPYTGSGTFIETAGSYTYLVSDANGCTNSAFISIDEPDLLQAYNAYAPILCHGENSVVEVTASGGTLPYSGTGTFTVGAGTYSYEVVDVNGCSSTTSLTIDQPDELIVGTNATDILCFGETSTVEVVATGGTMPYSGTGTFTELSGSHTYLVTDANGCTANMTIVITEPSVLVLETSADATVYYGYSVLSCTDIDVNATGGTGSLAYLWSNGFTGTSQSVCPSVATTYLVTATDENGCVATGEVNVCVVDVVCYAGSSSIAKVQVCHHGHTICINESAVEAHLAHGCTLGSCEEADACGDASGFHQMESFTAIQSSGVKLYPNPVLDQLSISFVNPEATNHIQIFTTTGQLVYQANFSSAELNIDVSTWQNAVYVVRINNSEEHLKFIKQ